MIKEKLYKGTWEIDKNEGISIECYVTKDSKRMLSLRGTAKALNLKGGGGNAILKNLKSNWIQPFLTKDLNKWLENIKNKKIEKIGQMIPIEGFLFVDICKAYINAQRSGLFTDEQNKIIKQWEKQNQTAERLYQIMSAFAKVGIDAFIDEITGYQEVRERDELNKLLAKYLSAERLAWAKMFDVIFPKKL